MILFRTVSCQLVLVDHPTATELDALESLRVRVAVALDGICIQAESLAGFSGVQPFIGFDFHFGHTSQSSPATGIKQAAIRSDGAFRPWTFTRGGKILDIENAPKHAE